MFPSVIAPVATPYSFATNAYFPSGVTVDEYEFLMVFLHGASVTQVDSLPRAVGDFDNNCLNKDLKRDAAVLSVERRPRVYLVCR